jgi:PAS domain S-box-containing protein
MGYPRLATASAIIPLAFALPGLAAWITGRLWLASLSPDFIPMAPATAIGFTLVGAALIALAYGQGTIPRTAVPAAACVVFVGALLGLSGASRGAGGIDWEGALVGQFGTFGAVPLARMSPLTSSTFALVAVALGALGRTRWPPARDLGGVLGIATLLTGTTVALGYAYGAPLLYGGTVIPMALTTGFAFMGTGLALVALAGPGSLPLRPFSQGAMRAARAEAERSRAEKALRDTERLARSLVEHLPQRIFVKDVDSRYIFCNSAFARDLHMNPSQIVGKDDFALFPRELAEGYRSDDRAVTANGAAREVDERYEAAAEARWIHTTKIPYRDEEGVIIGVLGMYEDVTDRKRSEEEIRRHARLSAQAEHEFRTLFAANPLPMWIYDRTTLRFLEVNDAAVRRYGYDRDEFLAMTIADVRPPEDVARLLTHLAQPREVWRAAGNWRHRLKSGEIIDVDVTSHVITFAGEPATLVVAQDVTELKRSVEALRTAEERTRFALQSANVGIWDLDYATGVLKWSETMEGHYGLRPGTFAGTFEAFVERMHPDDRASALDAIGAAMRSGSDFSLLNRSMWPDGTVRWLSGAGRIVLDERGAPVRGVGISMDVTDRRILEAQFLQAQKMEALGRLAGGVAHDFNNLLTVILGFSELLLAERDADDPRRPDIAEIHRAGLRAAGLTRQLLAFSRKQIIEPTLLDMNVVVGDLRGMLGRLIGEDVEVQLRLGPKVAPVMADRGQIEQIIMNLAVNARDAMPKGGRLTIETANVELDEHYAKTHLALTPGGYVALTVTDTGVGMTPEVQARLFEPFFTTKEPGKGTGLGMATVYGIVTQSRGSIGVYSEVGGGTSVKVYFPRTSAAGTLTDTVPAARPPARSHTVLVVEDEPSLREVARRLLHRLGHTVLVAADAVEALQVFEANPSIDVLLTDVVMPGGSGPELAGRLVRQRPALEVIYMSGYTEDTIVQHGVVRPGIAFLHKPFTAETLAHKLRDRLGP